jgi:hypothetical protein
MFMVSNAASAADANQATPDETRIHFKMVVSQGASTCLPNAQADVHIITQTPDAQAEDMFIVATGLPANTNFDFFVIQVPNAPFGLSWYQGDMRTGSDGDATQHFRGRFSIETFIIAPGVAPAPQVFTDPPFPDALRNPATVGPDGRTPGPVQTYHLGLWFNSPTDAQNAGCPNAAQRRHTGVEHVEFPRHPGTTVFTEAVIDTRRGLRPPSTSA